MDAKKDALKPLSAYQPNQSGVLSHIEYNDEFSKRLVEMGFTKGETIKVLHKAPLGDPLQIQIRDYLIAIRKQDASLIWLEDHHEN